MQHKKVVACTSAVVLALALACSKDSETPLSPSNSEPGGASAGPSGETLKASAPTTQAPVNSAQIDQLAFTAGKSTGQFDQSLDSAYSYEFEVRNAGSTTVCASGPIASGGCAPVTWTPSNCVLDFDSAYTWRVG